jgi:hypothetical protein
MRKVTLFCIVGMVVASTVWGEDAYQRDTLKGLPGVYVSVVVADEELKELGLTRQAIQKKMELELRKAGIRVLTVKDYEEAHQLPTLTLWLSVRDYEERGVVVSRWLRLQQRVVLMPSQKVAGAYTWELGGPLLYERHQLAFICEEGLALHIEAFANDFLTVNPQKPSAPKPKTDK